MKNIQLLDCTLRDGGSVNDWHFGNQNILNIYKCLNDSNIEFIETGFLENNIVNSEDKSIASSTKFFDVQLEKLVCKRFKAFAMINLGHYNIEDLPLKKDTLIDGIRLMFKKENIKESITSAYKIKEKGFLVSLNPVSITTYTDKEIQNLINLTNDLEPFVIYIVDTYGLMDKEQTIDCYNKFNKNLKENIALGYHSHNNLQLAFSNSIEVINTNNERKLIIDGSLYGMGKRAGNTNIELLAEYLVKKKNKNYDINKITNVIEKTIIPMHEKYEWGYSIHHYIAAINKCHSDYVTFLSKNNKFTISEINSILKIIDDNKRLSFDEKYINDFVKIHKNKIIC